ncbi:D-aminopeptidase [subsurface metagenome]
MKNVKIIYFVILFTLVALLGAGLVQAQESMTTQLQMVLEDAVNSPETAFPGAVLYVSSPDLGTWTGAAGLSNIETSIVMKSDDKFRAGSTIKPMIAVIILQLVEEGKFSLDDPMTAVLPESVTTKFAYSNRITVRMLLNHTSGMADCIGPVMNEIIADTAKVWEVDEWLNVASAQEPYFAPGEDWIYSNTDYILLGLVIEQATGRSWRDSLRERIIKKLNLENTLLPEPGDLSIPGDYAHGYMDLGAGLVDVTGVDPSMADAAGGSALVTTTTDLARFLEAVLAGEFFQNIETLAEMLAFVDVPKGSTPISGMVGYGLGMMKSSFPGNIEMVGHSGDTAGFSAFAFHLPAQDITISGMVNDMDPSGSGLRVLLPALEILISDFEPIISELDPASSALQGLLDQQVQEQDILGMAMAVRLVDGTVIGKASGYSDPSGEEAWSIDTVSAIGSVTKTYTAVVIMQLVEEGKLSLDDTIDSWFPQQPDGDKITVRMLLSHTSGLANYLSAQNVMEGKWNKEWVPMDLVAEANKIGPVGEPGSSEVHYSNTNFILLGLIVEEITGNSWAQEVESRIIKSLGLKDTTFLSKEGILDIMVGAYTKMEYGTQNLLEGGYQNLLDEQWYPHPSTVWSAGEIVTTLSDLMTFASALFDGKLVSRETLVVMAQPLGTDVDSGVLWSLGGVTLDMGSLRAFGMGGDIPGYHAFFVGVLDTKLIVTALVNTQEGDVIMPSISALQYISQSLSGAADEEVPVGNVYTDPEGRFSIPLIGDWTQVKTDGTYARFALTDPPLNMNIVTVESGDLYAGIDAALKKINIDPGALTPIVAGESLGLWYIFMYSLGDGRGVIVLAQVKDGTTYVIIGTGSEDVVCRAEPPADVMNTILGFTFIGGELVLPTTVEEFEAYINGFVGDTPPGLSIVIALGSDILYAKGFGLADSPKGMAATPDTVYQWGSMVKMVTVTALMQLYDKGLIDLDGLVSDYLDYFPAKYPITVGQLLNHSAGLPEANLAHRLWDLDGKPLLDPDLAARKYVEEITGPIFEPGSASAYANPHLLLAGQIVAEVSGKPYIEYVKENILTPLGMKNTDFSYSSDAMIAKAAAHAVPAAQVEGIIDSFNKVWELGDVADLFREIDDKYAWLNHYNTMAAWGGLKGPPVEAIRFMQMHINGGEFEGVRILSPESVALMQEIQFSTKGEPLNFTMGWFVVDDPEHPYVEHAGGGVGIRDLMRLYPNEGVAIVLMSNASGYDELAVVDAAANVVFSMMAGQ